MSATTESIIADVRRFNRFYTRTIGALGENLLGRNDLDTAVVIFNACLRHGPSQQLFARCIEFHVHASVFGVHRNALAHCEDC